MSQLSACHGNRGNGLGRPRQTGSHALALIAGLAKSDSPAGFLESAKRLHRSAGAVSRRMAEIWQVDNPVGNVGNTGAELVLPLETLIWFWRLNGLEKSRCGRFSLIAPALSSGAVVCAMVSHAGTRREQIPRIFHVSTGVVRDAFRATASLRNQKIPAKPAFAGDQKVAASSWGRAGRARSGLGRGGVGM
jgi:hypothetical protein